MRTTHVSLIRAPRAPVVDDRPFLWRDKARAMIERYEPPAEFEDAMEHQGRLYELEPPDVRDLCPFVLYLAIRGVGRLR